MLASLRPQSPPSFDVNRRRPQTSLLYPSRSPYHASQPLPLQMESFGAERRDPTPPSRLAAHAPWLGSSSYGADPGPDAPEQRSSPQARQRSWHHPYMHSTRAPPGASPPAQLDTGASPTLRTYDHVHAHDLLKADPQQRSPAHRSEQFHAASDQRSRAGPRADLMGHAQPVNISSHPPNAERIGGIGPSRNRGRSNTLSLPHPDSTRVRGRSFIGGRLHSPSHHPYSGHEESVSQPPRSWEEVRSYRDEFPRHQVGESALSHRQSPTHRPSSGQSPILFAPLSPNPEPLHLLPPPARRVSGQIPAKMINSSVMARAPQGHSRPGTPCSPLNMDSLSMEDSYLPSASGMAVPVTVDRQRSPADTRSRSDYFGPASSEWSRSSHAASDLARTPPPPSRPMTGSRPNSRGHPYRGSVMMSTEGVSPEHEAAPYYSGAYAASQPSIRPFDRALVGATAAHHLGISRGEQIERERFMMAQHHVSSQSPLYTPIGPHELGYQGDFVPPPGRMGHGGGSFVGAVPQQAAPVDRIAHSRRRRRPPYSYSSMITQAIASSPEGRMTLREIYTWISTHFSSYPMSGPDSQGWQNTVRHNLSLGKIFVKKARTAQDIYDSCSSGNPAQSQAVRGKGGWWTLHPVVLSQIRSGKRAHSDEFDDLERLVDMENAAAAASASSGGGLVSSLMDPASSTDSSDKTVAVRRLSVDVDQHKPLSRQRSYSDSVDPTQGEQRRSGSGYQLSIAPVSRQESIKTLRNASAGRSPRAALTAQPMPHDASSVGAASREDMPSVLQRRPDLVDLDRPSVGNRLRGHTIAAHEMSLHQPNSRADIANFSGEGNRFTRTASSVGAMWSPWPAFQDCRQTDRDVDMELAVASQRDSSLVLQEARETLVWQQRDSRAAQAESPESTGRMAIRGLLNS
ncbi:uncharacterized protein UMAG_06231 [Mycosarcoma maydis]|uniref:Fork-head domain-containing protein n=1 Tax=Mycosarcoma maydis TaxID=5270 RepID=A0A0D1DMV4_MYCMD|nr:uncharacterized protein UMAG_06231 [Ustilago maydis 521]KIS65854.1 hypothetical protein UMAG_06231 [Ustilago maydis 521]|eukprot:XP_011392584.1 hypothetical protein UMAG_06231 [Ustilago maydis 521]